MPTLKVDSIIDRNNTGAPTLTQGVTIPSGKRISGAGNINVVGALTVTSFVGNGNGLGQFSSLAKSYALKLILDPIPFRS